VDVVSDGGEELMLEKTEDISRKIDEDGDGGEEL
jgi:hypothetical protein